MGPGGVKGLRPAQPHLHHIGLCHYHLQQWPQALECVQQALGLDPAHDPARALLIAVRSEMR